MSRTMRCLLWRPANLCVKELSLLIIALLLVTGCGQQKELAKGESRPEATVEVLDEALNELIDPEARLEVLGEGYAWSEGPVWVEEHEFLLFSDIPNNVIHKWKEGEGVTEYLKPAGYTGEAERGGEMGSNGLIIGLDGHLLLCQHGDRRIARMEAQPDTPEATFTTLAGSYDGNRLNSPNDMAQHSSGDIYFTDPPYGLEEGPDDPGKELGFQGVYRITNNEVLLLADSLSRPNGIAFSPDEQTLYVANSDPDRAIWMAYDVLGDGGIANGRVFYDATESVGTAPGLPDGMTIDAGGTIYATGPGGVWIFSPEGLLQGKIHTVKPTSNCTIGSGGNMLYMTADDQLLRIPLR